jgi:hypothetical protein
LDCRSSLSLLFILLRLSACDAAMAERANRSGVARRLCQPVTRSIVSGTGAK